jgi:hypothetical protein
VAKQESKQQGKKKKEAPVPQQPRGRKDNTAANRARRIARELRRQKTCEVRPPKVPRGAARERRRARETAAERQRIKALRQEEAMRAEAQRAEAVKRLFNPDKETSGETA